MTAIRRASEASLDEDLAFARHLARVASELSLEYFQRGVPSKLKPDGSPVTDADVEIELELRRLIAEYRPDDGVLGEELGETGSLARRWVLDPIDGTRNFMEHRPLWGTHVALELEGEIVVGVITRPVLGSSWWARRGGGAHRADSPPAAGERRLSVSSVNNLRKGRVSLWMYEPDPAVEERVTRHCQCVEPSLDSLLRLAEGHLEALVDSSGRPWDLAPAVVLVEEAGGRYSDREGGRRLDLGGGRFSNGHVHAELEQLLRG
jgi:histidinol-phosphatase